MSDNEKLANPGPANMVALSMALFIYWLILTGKVTGSASLVAGYFVFACGIIQLIAAIIYFIRGEMLPGNLVLMFGILFLILGGMNLMLGYFGDFYKLPMDHHISGWTILFLGVVLIVLTPAYIRGPYYFSIALIDIDILLILLAFAELGIVSLSVMPIVGWLCLVGSILALIIGAGTLINTSYGREIIPLPHPKSAYSHES